MKHTPHQATGKVARVEPGTSASKRQKKATVIVPSPLSVSQLNCLELVGIDPRRWLELLLAHPEVPRSVVGKLRIVAVDDLRMLLAALAQTKNPAVMTDLSDDQPTNADDVLAELGLRRGGGPR